MTSTFQLLGKTKDYLLNNFTIQGILKLSCTWCVIQLSTNTFVPLKNACHRKEHYIGCKNKHTHTFTNKETGRTCLIFENYQAVTPPNHPRARNSLD